MLIVFSQFLGDTIYMPHNLDFRGRAYPIPPHLNHIGDDLSRALLIFAEGKPLGIQGLRWLKIHLANLYGYDKAPFADRVKWAEENMAHIKESATNPLKVPPFLLVALFENLKNILIYQGKPLVGQCR
jgi:DNA-directed RNA polymerase